MVRTAFDPDVLSTRIRQLRKELGMGRAKFSKTVGSSTGSNILWWEQGKRMPGAYYVFHIARACNVSADWLLGLTDERRPLDHEC